MTGFFYAFAFQLFQLGVIESNFWLYVVSITAGTATAAGCLVCTYVGLRLLKTKISKETYFYIFLVTGFSTAGYIILDIVLKTNLEVELLVVFSIILATPLSCVLAGYSKKTVWQKLRSMGLERGITLLALLLLILIPILDIVVVQKTIPLVSIGEITYPKLLFQNGNDTTKVQGQITTTTFTAEVPRALDTPFEAKQAVNITNEHERSLNLTIYLKNLGGNLSGVQQLQILLTFENGSEVRILNLNNGRVEYEELSLAIESHATIAIGIACLAQYSSSTSVPVLSLKIRLNELDSSMAISIDLGGEVA